MTSSTPTLTEIVKDIVAKKAAFRERLVREHFSDTPIALATIERLKIMPWDIELQSTADKQHLPENLDITDSYRLVFEEKARVVEYLPRRWEMHSVRASDPRHDLYLFRLRPEIFYSQGIRPPAGAFVQVIP